jgi:hypothetical protein
MDISVKMTSEDKLVDKLKEVMIILHAKVGDQEWKLHQDEIDLDDDTTNILHIAVDDPEDDVDDALVEYFRSISLDNTDFGGDVFYIDGKFNMETFSDDVFSINVHVPTGYPGTSDLIKRISDELNLKLDEE